MQHSDWFLDALKDISEFAEQERIVGVLGGLAVALETYATEAGVSIDQHEEVLRLLNGDRCQKRQLKTLIWHDCNGNSNRIL